MPEKSADEKAAEVLADAAIAEAKEKAAEENATLKAELAELKHQKDAADRATRKVAAELQKLQTQRKAADAGMTEEALKLLREEARAEVLAELEPQLKAAEGLKAQNRGLLLDADMKARALKAGVLPEKLGDFWKLRADEFDLTDDGKPMVKGKPGLDPDKHLEALKKLNPEWVRGTQASGSGAKGGTGTTLGNLPDNLSPIARLEAAHAAGMTE